MKRRQFISLPLPVLFLTLTSTVLASNTWYTDGVNGNDANDCQTALTACKTIGHAISLASSGDSIIVAAATYTENLTIGISLNVIGSGANTTIIDGGGVGGVVGISSGTVTLAGLTLRHGVVAFPVGYPGGLGWGAGIYNKGTLSVTASTITENSISVDCRYSCRAEGGGIYNSAGAKLTISDSTVAGNTVLAHNHSVESVALAYGGGIYNAGTMVMTNSTVAQNAAQHIGVGFGMGGGIWNGGSATISNSTISGNSALGGLAVQGGDIFTYPTNPVTLQNSIVANSSSGRNCVATITSKGYNLSSDNTCNFNGPGDRNNTDPLLGTFGYNGGPTQTFPLLPGSPAIDAGNPSGCRDAQGNLLMTDQRGMPRPDPGDTGGCDIGAYESQN